MAKIKAKSQMLNKGHANKKHSTVVLYATRRKNSS